MSSATVAGGDLEAGNGTPAIRRKRPLGVRAELVLGGPGEKLRWRDTEGTGVTAVTGVTRPDKRTTS